MRLVRNIGWGLLRALIVAAGFSGIVLIQYLIKGPGFLEKYNVDLRGLLSLYWLGGLIAGVALGILRPLTKYRSGSILTGVVVGIIAYSGGAVIMFGSPHAWPTAIWVGTSFLGLSIGVFGGNRYWEAYVEPNLPIPDSPPEPRPKFKIWKS